MYQVPEVETGYMDASICAIYDGNNYYIGFSPSFEYPKTVVERVLKGEELGYMEDIFGSTAKGRKGAIGVLTSGRVYRDELEEYAVIMALTKIVSKDVYEKWEVWSVKCEVRKKSHLTHPTSHIKKYIIELLINNRKGNEQNDKNQIKR